MRNQDLHGFLTSLFGEIDGYIYVPVKYSGGAWVRNFFKWPENTDVVENFILKSQTECDVFISPSIWKRDPGDDELTPDDWLGTQHLWTEFDGLIPKDLKGIPDPSIKVQSSGPENQHWYWRLGFLETNKEVLEKLNKRVTYALQGDMSSWDYVQVLRPPCTKNHKPNKGQTTKLLKNSTSTIKLDSVVKLEDPPKTAFLDESDYKESDIPDPIDVISASQWDPDIWKMFKSKITPKDRSKAMFAVACSMIKRGSSNLDVLSILKHLDGRWKKFNNREDQIKRLLALISNARLSTGVSEDAAVSKDEELLSYLRSALTVGKNLPPLEWVVDKLLSDGGISMITAKPGVGKTRAAMQMAMCMALGIPFLKYKIQKPKKILLVSNEMTEGEFALFHDDMMRRYAGDEDILKALDKNYLQLFKPDQFTLRTEEDYKRFRRLIELVEPDGIMIDTLMATGGNPENYSEMTSFFEMLHAFRSETGIFTLLNHHPRKETAGNPKAKTMDDIYGGRTISQYATTLIGMWREENPEKEAQLGQLPTEFYCIKQKLEKNFTPIDLMTTEFVDFKIKPRDLNPDDVEDYVDYVNEQREVPKQRRRKKPIERIKYEPNSAEEYTDDLDF